MLGIKGVKMGLTPADRDVKEHDAKAAHLTPWRFQPGNSGNPKGRPLGARNRLAETFLEDAYAAWLEHGKQALETLARENPSGFCKLIAGLMPRNVNLNFGLGEKLAEMLETMQRGDSTVTSPDTIGNNAKVINEFGDIGP